MGIVVRSAGKKGKGVFSLKDFSPGQTILKLKHNKIVSSEVVSKLSYHYQNHMGYVGKGRYAIYKSPEKYINHSCEPNAYFKHINSFRENVVAIKPIKKDEEIVADYTLDSVDDWKMKCQCGAENCRKTVSGLFSSLNKATQKKYIPYAPAWNKI